MVELIRSNKPSAEVALVGSHSCKVTMLAWMARVGANPQVRRHLGYHVEPGDNSLLTYSRDAAAEPLRQLSKMLHMVRCRAFQPQCTRSGAMSHALLSLGFDRWDESLEDDDLALDAVLETEPVEQPAEQPEEVEHSGPSSSSGESSGVDALLVNSSKGEHAGGTGWSGRDETSVSQGLFMHNIFSTVHELAEGSLLRFKCGRMLKASFTPVSQSDFAWPRCRVCFADRT